MIPSCLSTLAVENVRHSTRPRGLLCCLGTVWVPRPYLPTLFTYNLAVMVPFYQELGRLPPLESGWKAKDSYGPVTSPSVPRFDQTGHLLMGINNTPCFDDTSFLGFRSTKALCPGTPSNNLYPPQVSLVGMPRPRSLARLV